MAAKKILVVDDEVGIRELLLDILQDEGYQVQLAENASAARLMVEQTTPDAILLDIWMPDTDGITLLKEWQKNQKLTMPVIMMSGHGSIDTAVESTKIGAYAYLEKPIALQKLLKTVSDALKQYEARSIASSELIALGKSELMQALSARLDKLVQTDVNRVLLIGPPGGCGELCARYLHNPNTPWLVLHSREQLANAPIELLEQMQNGLLYVPEVATLRKIEQKGLKLLLSKAEKFNVRVVCETAENLPQQQAEGRFEAALLQQLSKASIRLPALSEHQEDIPEMVVSMANRIFVEDRDKEYKSFDVAALNDLRNADWPGDYAQLENVVHNLIQTSLGEKITVEDTSRVLNQFEMPADARHREAGAVNGQHPSAQANEQYLSEYVVPDLNQPLREARDAFERLYFEYHLKETTHNMSKLAETAGLERTHLYRKLKQLGIKIK